MNNIENFNSIQHTKLRNYNRAVMACNLCEDAGAEVASEYLSQFSEQEKGLILSIIVGVKNLGVKKVKEICTKEIQFEDVSNLEESHV